MISISIGKKETCTLRSCLSVGKSIVDLIVKWKLDF